MSVGPKSATFSSPPTHRSGAVMYGKGIEVLRMAESAKEKLLKLDGTDKDANPARGVVVSLSSQVDGFSSSYDGTELRKGPKGQQSPFVEMEGFLQEDGGLEVCLKSKKRRFESANRVSIKTSEKNGRVVTEFEPGASYANPYGPWTEKYNATKKGKLTVEQDPASGSLFILDDNARAIDSRSEDNYRIHTTKKRQHFGVDGPTSLAVTRQLKSVQDQLKEVIGLLDQLKVQDNSPSDLNPAKGVVVAADFRQTNGQKYSASMQFDPTTGDISEASIGGAYRTGDSLAVTTLENGTKRYDALGGELLKETGNERFERHPDGSLTTYTIETKADQAKEDALIAEEAELARLTRRREKVYNLKSVGVVGSGLVGIGAMAAGTLGALTPLGAAGLAVAAFFSMGAIVDI